VPPTIIQSVDRSLCILRLVASREGISLRELSRTLGLNPTTAHNLAGTMVRRGFLRKTETPVGYRLGPAMTELPAWSRRRAFEGRLEQAAVALAETFPQAVVTVASYTVGELLVRLRLSPQQPGIVQRPEHRTFAPYTSASGMALLAFAGAEVAAEYRRLHPLEEYAPSAWQNEHVLNVRISQSRTRGFTALKTKGAVRLAFPIYENGGDPTRFLGLSLETRRGMTVAGLAKRVRALLGELARPTPTKSAHRRKDAQ
jgi:DNA-binding IclR family transcriptional regulator